MGAARSELPVVVYFSILTNELKNAIVDSIPPCNLWAGVLVFPFRCAARIGIIRGDFIR
jgi:hypothetical protein